MSQSEPKPLVEWLVAHYNRMQFCPVAAITTRSHSTGTGSGSQEPATKIEAVCSSPSLEAKGDDNYVFESAD